MFNFMACLFGLFQFSNGLNLNDFILQIQKANFKRLKFERFYSANSNGKVLGQFKFNLNLNTTDKFLQRPYYSMAKIRR
jgi:hypothetical protein